MVDTTIYTAPVYSTTDVVARTGLTERQVHYWRMTGAITPSIVNAVGSGNRCVWSQRDLARLVTIGEFIGALDPETLPLTKAAVRRIWDGLATANKLQLGVVTIRLAVVEP